jgi:putative transposase
MSEDIYSRKIVGWEVHDRECGELAAQLLQRSVMREQCFKKPLVLHSDNGAPEEIRNTKSQNGRARHDRLSQ